MIYTILMARSILDCTCCSNHADWVAEDKVLANILSFCNSFNKILVNGIIYFHIVNHVMPIVALLPISFNLKKTWSKITWFRNSNLNSENIPVLIIRFNDIFRGSTPVRGKFFAALIQFWHQCQNDLFKKKLDWLLKSTGNRLRERNDIKLFWYIFVLCMVIMFCIFKCWTKEYFR